MIPSLHQRAISIQKQIPIPRLAITPALSADDLASDLGDWIVPTAQAIDEMIAPIEPHPDL